MKKNLYSNKVESLAWFLLVIFISSILAPLQSYAGGGGPTQPEVHGFTPIGVSDMVDPFTGDFKYNIPLMDVEGYPINIAYSSGVSMDQEASWVGLGWSLNTGAIVRSMRGVPDDFNGDIIEKEINQKPNINVDANAGATLELFGWTPKLPNATLKIGVGASFSNYRGVGTSLSFGPSFTLGKTCGGTLTGGFSLSGSSENGAGFSPSLSFQNSEHDNKDNDISRTTTIGAAFNSRAGLQQITYGTSLSREGRKAMYLSIMGMKFRVTNGRNAGSGSVSGAYDLGVNSYSPQAGPSMLGFTISGTVSSALTLFGADAQGNIGITYSQQWIPNFLQTIKSPSYGYFNSQNGESNKKAILDFNRDNDGSFTKYHRDLPSAFQTYDIFSIQAQGTGGSFRGFRNDVGYVFDTKTAVNSALGSVGIELGLGGLADVGVDVNVNYTNTHSGIWQGNNQVLDNLSTKVLETNNIVPYYSLIEGSEASVERDALIPTNFEGSTPVQFDIQNVSPLFANLTSTLVKGFNYPVSSGTNVSSNKRSSRIQTNNQLYFLTNKEVKEKMGVQNVHPDLSTVAKDHHIGEITQLGTDGRRYIFGLPVYNQFQSDVTFAVGDELYDNQGVDPLNDDNGNYDDFDGLLFLNPSDFDQMASLNNKRGLDHYYSKSTTPPYAHSFMLTSILSDDYIDVDATQGPSVNDMGSYVKFDYTAIKNFEWRTPVEENSVYFNEGMKTDRKDDKASYVHGKKDLYYLQKVETKNYIAIFKTKPREDGYSANGNKGGFNSDLNKSQLQLESITLYARSDFEANGILNATPIQKVEFAYSHSLCPAYPGNVNNIDGGGKLTLTDIYFSYQGSNKMKQRNYHFDYSTVNPAYDIKACDRWGTYKPNNGIGGDEALGTQMTNGDWPYALQDKTQADLNASAWSLTQIKLPSGGIIKVDYESDDYGFVQHLPAAKMFKIVAIQQDGGLVPTGVSSTPNFVTISKDNMGSAEKNKDIYFLFDDANDEITDYVTTGQQLYFRCLMDFNKEQGGNSRTKCEMVSGYGTVEQAEKMTLADGSVVGRIKLKGENLTDNGANEYSAITKAAILFGRMHLARTINDIDNLNEEPSGAAQGLTDVANALVGAFTSFGELVTGPNKAVYNLEKGTDLVLNKSFIRLKEPSGTKLGGGSRVSQIRMYDNWDVMTDNTASGFFYGQKFEYKLEDGRSSGVASYEPQLGGDENPWHKAYEVNQKKRFAMDDKLFIEEPVMESQFPSPVVGYSRVVISDLERTGVTRTATGKVVKEFYTARDFPTIVRRSNVETRPKNSFLPLLPKFQYLVASQGFTIELNDMHGKAKKEEVYAQNATTPISKVEYFYQTEPLNLDGYTNFRLKNEVQVINESGQLETAEIGVRYDAVADFRESTTQSTGVNIAINTNSFLFGFTPIVVPTVWPKLESTTNVFRSSTMNKTLNRFGILKETRANQDGSIVSTNNLAYDAQTGEVLATQTTTNFDDKIFSMNYPAYWEYPSFGQASKNILYSYFATNITAAGFLPIPPEKNHFYEGDEVEIYKSTTPSNYLKAWVIEKSSTGIKLIDKEGNPISMSNVYVKVIRSGYKNKQNTSMASLTALSNPITSLTTNNYKEVLNAGAVEFGDNWKTYCDCYSQDNFSTNPFILGTRGNWRPIRSYTHLSGRSQSNYNKNTNIRRDGVFTSYNPFYVNNGGQWNKNGANWTFVSEVTEFSPNGMTLETKDALGRHSTSVFGFNNTLTTGVAANTKSTQLAIGSFEDLAYTNCMDQGFFAKEMVNGSLQTIDANKISNQEAHSGRTSIKVVAGTSVHFGNTALCAPQETCVIATNINYDPNNPNAGTITISNGTPNYSVEISSPSGAEAYMINGNQIYFSFTSAAVYEPITVRVLDASGCLRVFEIGAKPKGTAGPNYIITIVQ